jgi:23S rRNA (cytidine1920-2'-O)/16S rRNA (cytidine1409-2'-O)-methyltransferase
MRKRADIVLVERGFFASRARAQDAIAAGLVRIGGEPLRKPSEDIAEDAAIEAEAPHPYVSRGGLKLAAALDASTGGFTDVLLRRGARTVIAVDVGRGQFDQNLASDRRVRSFESVDARAITANLVGQPPGAIVCDVSFISQRLVLPHVLKLAAQQAWLVSLIKPQFEVGPAEIIKGRVRSEEAMKRACADVSACILAQGWTLIGIVPSPALGGAGAREFLVAARRG